MDDKPKSKLEQIRATAEAAREAKRLRNLAPIPELPMNTRKVTGAIVTEDARKTGSGASSGTSGNPSKGTPIDKGPRVNSEAKPKFDRNQAHREYMKEYMRKRRQKEQKK